MKTIFRSASLVLALAVTISACDTAGPLEINDEVQSEGPAVQALGKYVYNRADIKTGTFTVCKSTDVTTTEKFTFNTSFEDLDGTNPTITPIVQLGDGECADVAVVEGNQLSDWITISEDVPAGWVSPVQSVEIYNIDEVDGVLVVTGPFEHGAGNTLEGRVEKGKSGCLVIFNNEKLPPPPPPPTLLGRITGGGSVFTDDRTRITHGFQLRCDAEDHRQNLEINRGGDNFHLESLTSAVCTNDPLIDERPPTAGFDTYEGVGVGRFNGVSGYDIEFRLTDTGQPGRNDEAEFTITGPDGGIVVSNILTFGNHQTHRQTGR